MATITIDDEIAAAREDLGAIEAELAAKRDAAAAARADLDQLEAQAPAMRSGYRNEAWARWQEAELAAARRHAKAVSGLEDLKRLIVEQSGWVKQLEARRVPVVDDAIAADRARLADVADELRTAQRSLEAAARRSRDLDASAALGEPLPAGEPAATVAAADWARTTIAGLEAEAARLETRVATLLERRGSTVAGLAAAARAALRPRWAVLATEGLAAAARLQSVAADLDTLDEEHRAIGARYGERPDPVPTVGELRFEPYELEVLVRRARGLALGQADEER